jgi:hypothetical protein
MAAGMCIGLIGCALGITALCDCDLHSLDVLHGTNGSSESVIQEKPVSIEIDTQTGHILMPVWIEGDGPHWFVLDTGNQNTTFFAHLAEKIGIETKPLGEMGGAGSGSITVQQASDVHVGMGKDGTQIGFDDPMVTILPDAAMLPPFGDKTVVGFLGATTIEQFMTSIDYKDSELVLCERELYVLPEDARVMDMKLAFGFPYFEGSLKPILHGQEGDEIKGSFLLDLGDANSIGIDFSEAKQAGLIDADDPAQKRIGIGQGIDGVRFEMRTAPATSITMGGMVMEEDRVVFSTTPDGGPPIPNLVGVVGSGCFDDKVVTLDYEGGRLILSDPVR